MVDGSLEKGNNFKPSIQFCAKANKWKCLLGLAELVVSVINAALREAIEEK